MHFMQGLRTSSLISGMGLGFNRGEMVAAVLAASIHLGVGLINSAAMSF